MSLSKDKSKLWLIIALVLMVVSMVVSSFIQSDSGNVTVKTLSFESISGHTMSAKLYIPENATKETPAPCVVYAHGWYNSKENGDTFVVEYARRGYVVLAYDMYSHGNSEDLDNVRAYDGGNGMYDACFYASTLPYVDAKQIIASGHSAGSNAVSKAVVIDNNAGTELIRACILVSYDPVVMDTENGNKNTFAVAVGSNGNYNNIYGNRDAALIAGQYDDYFFTVKEGSKPITATRDYLTTNMAKAFVTFGNGPDKFSGDAVEAGKFYTETINGKETVRVIYNPSTIHAQTWFNKNAVAAGITFLQTLYPSGGTVIDVNNQVWFTKAVFNGVGLVGFWLFLAFFAIFLLRTRHYESLATPIGIRPSTDKKDIIWSLGTSVIKIGCSILIIWTIMGSTMYSRIDAVWKQKNTFCISTWAAINGVVILATFFAWYFLYAKKNGVDLRKTGVILPKNKILKTIGISVLTCFFAWLIVFMSDYFFQTDFRFWQWSVRAFTASKLVPCLPFLPLFLFFYICNSIAINVQGYSTTLCKNEHLNLFILGILNCLSPLIIILIQYTTFASTGMQMWGAGYLARIPTWLHTSVIILFLTPYIARAIYKRTSNPYIGGIINGILVTLCMCMNSCTLMGSGL